jgi:hypothetical protein
MTTKRTAASSIPGAKWVRPWWQLVEITFSVPVVIGYRTVRMVAGGWPPDARERREMTRMVSEKAEAFGKAAVAAVVNPPKDTATALGNVLAPVHKTVSSNRRRLIGS